MILSLPSAPSTSWLLSIAQNLTWAKGDRGDEDAEVVSIFLGGTQYLTGSCLPSESILAMPRMNGVNRGGPEEALNQ